MIKSRPSAFSPTFSIDGAAKENLSLIPVSIDILTNASVFATAENAVQHRLRVRVIEGLS